MANGELFHREAIEHAKTRTQSKAVEFFLWGNLHTSVFSISIAL